MGSTGTESNVVFVAKHSRPQAHSIENTGFKWEVPQAKILEEVEKAKLGTVPYLHSSRFRLGGSIGRLSEWCLQLYPGYTDDKGVQWLSLFLWMTSLDSRYDFVDVTYGLQIVPTDPEDKNRLCMDLEKMYWHKPSGIRRFTRQEPSFGWQKYVEVSQLGTTPRPTVRFQAMLSIYSQISRPGFPLVEIEEISSSGSVDEGCNNNANDNDTSSVPQEHKQETEGTVSFPDEDLGNNISEVEISSIMGDETPANSEVAVQSVRKLIANLWTSKANTDKAIETKDTSFPIHSYVLRARSKVFADFFALDKENNKTFNIVDFDTNIVEGMLEFMYTNESPVFSQGYDGLLKLWEASKCYQIESLEHRCLEEMLQYVNMINFNEIYGFYVRQKAALKEEYNISEFVKMLLEKRKECPSILSDYPENKAAYFALLFT